MSAASDESIENIDFGGRFARQFFNNNWPNIDNNDPTTQLLSLNPTTSTPVASDNSICDSGYESFGHRKSSASPTNSSILYASGPIDINNNTNNNDDNNNSINSSNNNNNVDSTPTSIRPKSQSVRAITTTLKPPTPHTTTANTVCTSASTIAAAAAAAAAAIVTNSGNSSATSDKGGHSAPSSISVLADTQTGNNTANNNNNNGLTNVNMAASNTTTPMQPQQRTGQNQLSADEFAKLSAGIGLMKLIMTSDVVVRQQRSNSLFTTTPAVASTLSSTNPWSCQDVYHQCFNNVDKIERAATLHRTAASYSEPQYTWSGQLPSRSYKNPIYSCKVFLGGVPWDVTEQGLLETFGRFGPLRIQWPGKDVRHHHSGHHKAGYVYLIYESERHVKALLQACTQDFGAGSHPEKYFYQLSSRRMRFKEVQAIPWVLADSNWISNNRNHSGRPDTHRTVFVGALHGMMTAEGLAQIMNDLFGNVAYVGIDSDKHKYPLGSGRVTFTNHRSYMKAVSAAFIEVKSSQFTKKIQLDPYFEISPCSTCHVQNGAIFCRDCLRYFCKTCWNWRHSIESIDDREHRPIMRKKRET